jgi:deoxyribose-phosphate aldolase
MALRLEELAKTIDHSLLDPTATLQEVSELCEAARAHHFASVCVLPFCVPRAAEALKGCDVKVCTVVSYPFGADVAKAKIAAAESCIQGGADELDVVMNTSALRSGEFRYVRDELGALVRAVRIGSVNMGKGIVLLKVVLECSALDDKLKRLACRIVEEAGADFVETSSGFGGSRATPEDVELLRDVLPEAIGVKANGGIETAADAEMMIAAGAGRIGTAYAAEIIDEFAKARQA